MKYLSETNHENIDNQSSNQDGSGVDIQEHKEIEISKQSLKNLNKSNYKMDLGNDICIFKTIILHTISDYFQILVYKLDSYLIYFYE